MLLLLDHASAASPVETSEKLVKGLCGETNTCGNDTTTHQRFDTVQLRLLF